MLQNLNQDRKGGFPLSEMVGELAVNNLTEHAHIDLS